MREQDNWQQVWGGGAEEGTIGECEYVMHVLDNGCVRCVCRTTGVWNNGCM